MSNLPQKIKFTIQGKKIEFSLTDKREIKYYGKTKTSNESLWRTDKLEDDEVFYQSEWGWGVFVKIEERELSLGERVEILRKKEDSVWLNTGLVQSVIETMLEEHNTPSKLITLTYNNETIEVYE